LNRVRGLRQARPLERALVLWQRLVPVRRWESVARLLEWQRELALALVQQAVRTALELVQEMKEARLLLR
jgi:hypothetical protein